MLSGSTQAAPEAVKLAASIDLKRDEPGLFSFCEQRGWPLRFYTAAELAAGLVLNIWLGLDIWDYSALPCNLMGQICVRFTALWCLLAGPVIVAFDWLDHWLCNGERPRYRLV